MGRVYNGAQPTKLLVGAGPEGGPAPSRQAVKLLLALQLLKVIKRRNCHGSDICTRGLARCQLPQFLLNAESSNFHLCTSPLYRDSPTGPETLCENRNGEIDSARQSALDFAIGP